MNVRELHKKLKQLDLDYLKEQAVDLEKTLIIKLNKEQLDVGIDSEGDLILPDYSFAYALFKKGYRGYKAPFGTPDLEVTGDFKEGFEIEFPGDGEYDIYSEDVKNDMLTDRYDNIFGLTPENIEIAKKAVTLQLKRLLKKELKL